MIDRRRLAVLACVLAVALASCCPVATVTTVRPTAFAATVLAGPDGSWLAETPEGVRYRLPEPAPAKPGARVYLEGTVDSEGNVTIASVRAIGGS